MKNLKTYESVNALQNWINEVMNNCKDIMSDLKDHGMTINTKRSLYMEENNYVLVDCTMSYYSPLRWGRFGVKEVYDRLSYYMESEGFEEIERRTGNVGSFPFINGEYQGKISFKKSGLDSDYIFHLKYLKKYNQD